MGCLRRRHIGRLAAAGLSLALAIGAGGCDLGGEDNLERGRDLFVAKCGTCHSLDQAATTSEIGPDLDAAFAAARDGGSDDATIEGVVRSQIANPRPANPDQTDVYMPENIVTGRDAENVAAYVGEVAGVPGIEPPLAPGGEGGQVYANSGCGSCHTLEAAASSGTVGPNLDESLARQDSKQIEQSIVDPGAEIVQGFQNVMPGNYESTIPAEELELLVEFLANCAGDPDAKGCT